MGSRIPVVDLSSEELKPGSSDWNSACHNVRKALEEYGCLEVLYKNPSLELHRSIFNCLEELFQLPQETKLKNASLKPSHGYVRYPLHESFGIEYATNKEECQKFTDLMWPEGKQNFSATVHAFANVIAELQKLLVKMICESYGMEEQKAVSHNESTSYLVRLLAYDRSRADTNVGLGGHTDKSFFTIIHQDRVNGLETRTKDGDWIAYDPTYHSSFAVLVGDACMAWSNDRIKACFHRVTVDGKEVRYAVGLFSFMKGVTEVPKELVDEEHPLQYKPFVHQGLLDFFQTSSVENKTDSSLIKAYCGI